MRTRRSRADGRGPRRYPGTSSRNSVLIMSAFFWDMRPGRLARHDPDLGSMKVLVRLVPSPLGDYDGLYDPTDFNDRLLWVLKGIMSEAGCTSSGVYGHEGVDRTRPVVASCSTTRRSAIKRSPAAGWPSIPTSKLRRVRLVFDHPIGKAVYLRLLRYLVHHAIRLLVTTSAQSRQVGVASPQSRAPGICCIIPSMPATTVTATARSIRGECSAPTGPRRGRRTIQKPEDCLVLLENRCSPHRRNASTNQQQLAANRARTMAVERSAVAVPLGESLPAAPLWATHDGGQQVGASRPASSCWAMIEYGRALAAEGLAVGGLDDRRPPRSWRCWSHGRWS